MAAAAVNVLVGVGALWLARGTGDRTVADTAPVDVPVADTSDRTRRAVAIVIAVSGAASLALEIVWFRILLQFLPATTYAFTTMLATVLGGIALGGAIGARVLAKPRDWHWILVRVLIGDGHRRRRLAHLPRVELPGRMADISHDPGVRRGHTACSDAHGRRLSDRVEARRLFADR